MFQRPSNFTSSDKQITVIGDGTGLTLFSLLLTSNYFTQGYANQSKLQCLMDSLKARHNQQHPSYKLRAAGLRSTLETLDIF